MEAAKDAAIDHFVGEPAEAVEAIAMSIVIGAGAFPAPPASGDKVTTSSAILLQSLTSSRVYQ
jgi:hypothetical protein